MNTITIENPIGHRPCIKRTSVVFIRTDLRILLVQNTLKKIKIPSFNILQPENRPQLLELRVGLLRRCWKEGEMWNHTFTIPWVACDRPFRAIAG